MFQAPGQLGGPCGVGAAAAGGVSCSAGGTFPPEEDPTGCLPAAPHPAPVHAGGTQFVFYLMIFNTLNSSPKVISRICLCVKVGFPVPFVGNWGNGCLEAGPPETVPGFLCREASIAAAYRLKPGQASPGQASIGPVTASGG